MPTPIDTARAQRLKDSVERCLRDGYAPFRVVGGKGSATAEAARRLAAEGFKETRNSLDRFVRTQERRKARGLDHWLPEWSLFAEPGLTAAQIKAGAIHRWLLTAAQDDTDVHPRFWQNLQAYAAYMKATLVVAGFTYQQMRHTDRLTLTSTYRPELRDHLRFDPLDCGPVMFAAEMNTLPTATQPLSGLQTYGRGRDTVFPHAKLAYQTVPTMPGQRVPFVCTTGAVTVPNYIEKKAGQKARFHHTLGAALVEVDDRGESWVRQISASADGSFQDLDARVTDGRVTRGHRVTAITWGDVHLPSVPAHVYDALWSRSAESMIEALRPMHQFFHDLVSFDGISRWVQGDPIYRARMTYRGESDLRRQVSEAAAFLRDTQREWCQSVDVAGSNHNQRLDDWARKAVPREDVENCRYWHECNLALLTAQEHADDGFDLYVWALRREDPHGLEGITFVTRGESYLICQDTGGIECGLHGHEGPNGSRGSAAALAKLAAKVNAGHWHAPVILDGVYGAGITGNEDQGYNTGPTSWARAHIVTYPNGKRTLISQAADGRWRA